MTGSESSVFRIELFQEASFPFPSSLSKMH